MKSLIVFTWSAIEPITLMAFDCAFSVYGFFGRPACLGLPKMAFWGDLGSFEGSDGKIVRSDCKNGSWVAKNAFSGCLLGIRGFTHVSPYNPDVVGSPTASVFHSIERGQPPSSSCVEY